MDLLDYGSSDDKQGPAASPPAASPADDIIDEAAMNRPVVVQSFGNQSPGRSKTKRRTLCVASAASLTVMFVSTEHTLFKEFAASEGELTVTVNDTSPRNLTKPSVRSCRCSGVQKYIVHILVHMWMDMSYLQLAAFVRTTSQPHLLDLTLRFFRMTRFRWGLVFRTTSHDRRE
jgi:hypothetical protein